MATLIGDTGIEVVWANGEWVVIVNGVAESGTVLEFIEEIAGGIMPQLQTSNLGNDLFNGTLL